MSGYFVAALAVHRTILGFFQPPRTRIRYPFRYGTEFVEFFVRVEFRAHGFFVVNAITSFPWKRDSRVPMNVLNMYGFLSRIYHHGLVRMSLNHAVELGFNTVLKVR